jgi:putative DNA modification/repair radical SAM protein
MSQLNLRRKLSILADAAKYDASCASSGAPKRGSSNGRGVGSTDGSAICHAYAPDGRCISLLKILLTNYCVYDCAYCVNRVSSNQPRARFTAEEVVDLTLGFYKRNYIEGLFLSSGIIRDEDYTLGEMVRVARLLRQVHDFRGYIHLKLIPNAAAELVLEAGLYADRVSINVELPGEASLKRLAPEKDAGVIRKAMGGVRLKIDERAEAKSRRAALPPAYAPAGQSTQIVVGADAASDGEILGQSERLYGAYALRRVYYSAFSPIPEASAVLPVKPPPLRRENRLYQADWLLRYYGFSVAEIAAGGQDGMLDLDVDPKLAWALKHRDRFPVDVNSAEREMLLRVPGLGKRAVDKIVAARRHAALRLDDIARLSAGVKRTRAFLITADHHPAAATDRLDLRDRLVPPPRQLGLF